MTPKASSLRTITGLRHFCGRPLPKGALHLIIAALLLSGLSLPAVVAADAATPPFWGVALHGDPITGPMLDAVERETGLQPQMVVFFRQWPSPGHMKQNDFPLGSLNSIWGRGSVPCLTWEPMYYEGERETMIPHQDILSGRYDDYIRAFARQAKAWGKPLLMRWGHEMNLSRYHWGTSSGAYGPESPDLYKRMFQHIVSLFRAEGAINVLWVFCPNSESVPNLSYDATAGWNRISAYYPGDSWVDVLGLDGYDWGESRTMEKDGWRSHRRSFKQIFEPAYRELSALAKQKPLVIFETAGVDQGEKRAVWLKEAFVLAGTWRISGIVWFQAEKECDWRLEAERDRDAVGAIRRAVSAGRHWVETLARHGYAGGRAYADAPAGIKSP